MSKIICCCCKTEYKHAREFAEQGIVHGQNHICGKDLVWMSCGVCRSTTAITIEQFNQAMFIKEGVGFVKHS